MFRLTAVAILSLIFATFIACKVRDSASAVADEAQEGRAPLRSHAAKDAICAAVVESFRDLRISQTQCLSGVFTVTRQMFDEIGGRRRTTRLNVELLQGGNTFNASIARSAGITDEGKVYLSRDWPSVKVLRSELDSQTTLLRSHAGSRNVRHVDDAQGFPQAALDWRNYAGTEGFDDGGFNFYEVRSPENLATVIGYIIEEDTCDESQGICNLSTAWFNLRGQRVGDIDEESRGIFE